MSFYKLVASRIKTLVVFGIFFSLVSMVGFAALVLLWPGSSFFPKNVYTTKVEHAEVALAEGSYDVLLFTEGAGTLSVSPRKIEPPVVAVIMPSGAKEMLPVAPREFFFDDAPGETGIRGRAIGHFILKAPNRIASIATLNVAALMV